MVKAVQISAKRCGSTFLMNCLDSHPHIEAYEELFVINPKHPPSKKYLDKVKILPYQNGIKTYGHIPYNNYLKKIWDASNKSVSCFKLMYNQIDGGLEDAVKNLHIIHLKRKNHFRRVISNENAHFTDFKVLDRLKPKVILKEIQRLESTEKQGDKRLSKYDKYIEVFYEDIIGEREGRITWMADEESEKICEFFGISSFPMYSYTKKKNSRPITDYLPEPENTIKLLNDTKYAGMIKE